MIGMKGKATCSPCSIENSSVPMSPSVLIRAHSPDTTKMTTTGDRVASESFMLASRAGDLLTLILHNNWK